MKLQRVTIKSYLSLSPALKITLAILWLAAIVAIPVRNRYEKPAWDVFIYLQGVDSLRIGHDPYADAIAIQQKVHAERAIHPDAPQAFSYVYSPITLPLLHFVATHPLWLSGIFYGSLYFAGVLAQIWGSLQLSDSKERPVFLFLSVLAAFCPGLLACDILWSGNVAFILYGAVVFTAVIGWRRGQWLWFYVAVVMASCFKIPLLSLALIAPLTAERQWKKAAAAAATGIALFAVQPFLWPSLFRNYLVAVSQLFSMNRDFGAGPAGLFSGVLYDRGIAYSPANYVFYISYALPVFLLLVWLSRKFFAEEFTLQQWGPVVLVGVLLLNPRILEYDEVFIAIPLTLILWRFCATLLPTRKAVLLATTVFLTLNLIAYQSWAIWKLTEGPLLFSLFWLGVWTLREPTAEHVMVYQAEMSTESLSTV